MKVQIEEPSNAILCSLTPFQQNEKWGYQNNQGKVVIDPVFDYAPDFKFQTELLVETSEDGDSQYYLYDRSGNRLFCFNELFEEDISEINRYKESALFFADVYDWTGKELSGMVNEQGKIIIPAKFISIESVGKDVFKVGYVDTDSISETDPVKMKYGVYDSTGKEMFAPQFSEVGEFECSFAIADLDGKQVLINNSGILVVGTESNSIERVSRMHYFLYRDNDVQLFTRPDEFGGTYDNIRSVQGNNIYFIGERKGLSVLIDMYMTELGIYDSLLEKESFLIVCNHGKWGIVNYRNEIVTPIKYKSMEEVNPHLPRS